MPVGRFSVGLAAAFVLGLGAMVSVPSVAATTAMPSWSVGDYWVYNVSGPGPVPAFGGGPTIRYDVLGRESLTVGAATVDAYEVRVNLTVYLHNPQLAGPIPTTGDAWFRVSDLAPVKYNLAGIVRGTPVYMNVSYDPPPSLRWPLEAGDTWTSATVVTSNLSVAGSWTLFPGTQGVNQTVLPDTTVSVAAGSFLTTPVRQTEVGSSGYTVTDWSAQAGNWVSRRTFDDSGNKSGSVELQAYRYQGELTFLGLPILAWIAIGAAVIAVASIVLVLRLRRSRRETNPPRTQPGTPGSESKASPPPPGRP